MVCCSAPGCSNHSDRAPKGISFHTFPLTDPVRLAKWLSMMRREGFAPTRSSRICSAHFSEDCFERNLRSELSEDVGYQRRPRRVLLAQSVPTIFAHTHNKTEERPMSTWQKKREEIERRAVSITAQLLVTTISCDRYYSVL